MKARMVTLTAILTLSLTAAHTAVAGWIRPPAPVDRMPLAQREHWLHHSWNHYAYVAAHGHGRVRRSNARAARWAARELARVRALIRARQLYVPASIRQAFLCIHHGEGAWNANTGNGYYGGEQMDIAFQQAYGAALLRAKGTADHWTPAEQLHVAYVAYRSGRGFWPWPNTARACGLI